MIVPHVDVPHFDYLKFRLFLLSLLWRMGVSKLEFFEDVNLGGKHEKALRLALMSENSLDAEQYSCALIGVLIDGTFSPDLILRPKRVLGPDLHGYGIVIGGMLFQFLVMSHPPLRYGPNFAYQRPTDTESLSEMFELFLSFLNLLTRLESR